MGLAAIQLLLIIAHRHCVRGVHIPEKIGVVVSWLTINISEAIYYSEHYNRDVQVQKSQCFKSIYTKYHLPKIFENSV